MAWRQVGVRPSLDIKFWYEKGFCPQSKDNVITYLTMSQAKARHPLSQHRQAPSKCQALAWVLVIFKEDQVYTINIYDTQVFVIRSTHYKANTYMLFTTQLYLWCGVPMKKGSIEIDTHTDIRWWNWGWMEG